MNETFEEYDECHWGRLGNGKVANILDLRMLIFFN